MIRYSQQPNNKPDYSGTTSEQAAKAELDELRANCDWTKVSRTQRARMAALGLRLPGHRYARAAKEASHRP